MCLRLRTFAPVSLVHNELLLQEQPEVSSLRRGCKAQNVARQRCHGVAEQKSEQARQSRPLDSLMTLRAHTGIEETNISRRFCYYARCLRLPSCSEAFDMKPNHSAEAAAHGIGPVDTRVEELLRENGALRRQIAYFEGLLRTEQEVIPHILRLSDDLRGVVCDFNAHLEYLNKEWTRTGEARPSLM